MYFSKCVMPSINLAKFIELRPTNSHCLVTCFCFPPVISSLEMAAAKKLFIVF